MRANTMTHEYTQQRLRHMKRTLREMRESAGLLQKDIASALGCTRTRIVTIENEESPSFYDTAEVEIVAALCGRPPTEVTALSDQDQWSLAQLTTETLTSAARGSVLECHLSPPLQRYVTKEYASPPRLLFSPDGAILASMMDPNTDEDAPSKPKTLFYWDVSTGESICTLRQRYVEHFAPISASLVALACSQPSRKLRDSAEGNNHLILMNPKTQTILHDIPVPNQIGNIAINADCTTIAVFLPTTTLIGAWDIATGQQLCALELATRRDDPTTLGDAYIPARSFDQLPRERKFESMAADFQADRFEFLDTDILTLRLSNDRHNRSREISISTAQPVVDQTFNYPVYPFSRVTHQSTADWQIAVTKQDYNELLRSTFLELYYLTPGKSTPLQSHYARFSRELPGWVDQLQIIDESCILGVQQFRIPYYEGLFDHYRQAVVNAVTGRIAVLDDAGRLSEGEDMLGALLSPTSNLIAYWVTGDSLHRTSAPRLCLQQLHRDSLQVFNMTLARLFREDVHRQQEEWKQVQRRSDLLDYSQETEELGPVRAYSDDFDGLIAQLRARDEHDRHDAIRDLIKYHLDRVDPLVFLDMAHFDPAWSIRHEALSVLAAFRERAPLDELLRMLNDPQLIDERAHVISILGELGKRAPLDLLISIAKDPDAHPADRESAVEALGASHDRIPMQIFEDALVDPEPAVRAAAAECAAIEDLHISSDLLISCLTDPDEYTRKNIVNALIAHPVRFALLPLIQLINDPDYQVRESAARAIGTLRKTFGESVPLDSLLQFAADPNNLVREMAIDVLADYPDYAATEALDVLLSALKDEDRFVRLSAAQALTLLGRPLPELHKPALEEALHDPDPRTRKAITYVLMVMKGLADPHNPPPRFQFNFVTVNGVEDLPSRKLGPDADLPEEDFGEHE